MKPDYGRKEPEKETRPKSPLICVFIVFMLLQLSQMVEHRPRTPPPLASAIIPHATLGIPNSPSFASSGFMKKGYLWKVPNLVRQVKRSAYEPHLFSIGPFHHNANPHLEEMQVYKAWCLERILGRNKEQTRETLVSAMKLKQARKWYFPSLSTQLDDKKFEEMMLHDACFIVELLSGKLWHDPFFNLQWVQNAVGHDLLLLENQIPFFVLAGLYNLIKVPSDERDFASQAFTVLSIFLPGAKKGKKDPSTVKDTGDIKHLLSLVHDNWSPSSRKQEEAKVGEGDGENWEFTLCAVAKRKEKQRRGDIESGVTKRTDHNSFKLKFTCCAGGKKDNKEGRAEWKSIRCATELEEAGIQFKKATEEKSLFDVSFTDATNTMEIPTFKVNDHTESLFRNLIAHELFQKGPTYVIDYVTLMDNLINTDKDVKLLRHEGIIENMLGDDDAVAQLLNRLRDNVTLCGDTFYYEKIFVDVKKHCARRLNTWRARFWHDYFYSPWAIVSSFAALLLILITIVQFIFGVIDFT